MADQAWQLLKLYLDRLGPRDGHVYYRCVASKLLSAGAALPTWLVNDYKVRRYAPIISSLQLIVAVIVFGLKGHCFCHLSVVSQRVSSHLCETSQELPADPKRCHRVDENLLTIFFPKPLFLSCTRE